VRLIWGVAAVLVTAAGSALANPAPRVSTGVDIALELDLDLVPMPRVRPSLGKQLQQKMTLWTNELGAHLNLLTGDMLDMRFDVTSKRGWLRVGALSSRGGFVMSGRVKVRGTVARIKPRLTLALRSSSLELELPAIEVATQNVQGERSVELRVPIFEGRF
jgi:hypothetical protein